MYYKCFQALDFYAKFGYPEFPAYTAENLTMEAIPMSVIQFPVIDLQRTGANIVRLRQARGLSVRDLQQYFGFEEPVAIYKWQKGQSLPTVDNLFALSTLLGVPMNEILVESNIQKVDFSSAEQQAEACCSPHFWGKNRVQWVWQNVEAA